MSTVPASHDHDDLSELAAVVGDLEAGFNAHDPARLAQYLADDAFAINVFGSTVEGRDALVAAHADGMARMFGDQRAAYRIEETALAGPDAALLRLRIGPESAVLQTVALWVLVRRGGRWRVVAMQGTLACA